MENHNEAYIHLTAGGGPHAVTGTCALKGMAACGVPTPGQHSEQAGTMAYREEPMQEQVFRQDLWPMGEPMLKQYNHEGPHT